MNKVIKLKLSDGSEVVSDPFEWGGADALEVGGSYSLSYIPTVGKVEWVNSAMCNRKPIEGDYAYVIWQYTGIPRRSFIVGVLFTGVVGNDIRFYEVEVVSVVETTGTATTLTDTVTEV